MEESQAGAGSSPVGPAAPSAPGEEKATYDAFLSYSSRADYRCARRVEAFLESIHQTPVPHEAALRQLQICRDGSDFRLPGHRKEEPPDEDENEEDPVWQIIRSELARSHYLIVLCSPGSVRSRWVTKEIKWFIRERGVEQILPAVTGGDPIGAPEEVFPEDIRRAGLHRGRIWYDLRGLDLSQKLPEARDPEDELVRLASDLLPWDADSHGPLAALWQRERLRQRRRQAMIALIAGLALISLGVLALWQAARSRAATARARANAIVIAAESSEDPVLGALLLAQLADLDEPQAGMRVAQKLIAAPLPQAVLRGHTGEVRDVAFSPDGSWVLTGSWDGSARLWPANGRGDPRLLAKFSKGAEKVAFSPDGAWIAVASRIGELRILSTGAQGSGQTFSCGGKIISWSFSPDSRWLATVTEQGDAALWPAGPGHGEPLPVPKGRKVLQAQWSREPETGWLAARDGTVWRFHRGMQQTMPVLNTVEVHENAGWSGSFHSAVFSADGSVVSFAADRQILVGRTDGSGPRLHLDLERPADIVMIDLSADGSRLLATNSAATVSIWSTTDGNSIRVFDPGSLDLSLDSPYLPPDLPREPTDRLFARFSPDGNYVITLATDSLIRVWDAVEPGNGGAPDDGSASVSSGWNRLPRLTLRGQEGSQIAAFDQAGKVLATGANDGTVRVWRLSLPPEPRKLAHPGAVSSISFGTDSKHLLSVTRWETARWWSNDRAQRLREKEQDRDVNVAALDPEAMRAVTGYKSGHLRLWDLKGEQPRAVRYLRSHASEVRGVELRPEGERVLSWGDDSTVIVQRIDGKGSPAILRGFTEKDGKVPQVSGADLRADGLRAVTAFDDGSLMVWPTDGSGRPVVLKAANGETRRWSQVVFSPDGRSVLAVSTEGIEIWPSGGRGKPLALPGAGDVKEGWGVGAFSPDGAWAAAGSFAGRVWAWHSDGKTPPKVMRQVGELAHIGPVSSLAFAPDSRRFVTTGGMDARACVWSLDRPGDPVVIRQGGALTDAEFSPDGSLLASASEMGSVLISRVTWPDLVAYLRGLTSAVLTVEQRIKFLGETEAEARKAYEEEERRYGRTPLPQNWVFNYPF